jgi:gliding motility-associated-like protein
MCIMNLTKKAAWITFCICLISGLFCRAQQENIWAFGLNSGLNFNGATPTPYSTAIVANEASASVCDAAGQLLFYTNGTKAWDRNHNVMPNGTGLQTLTTDNASSTQGALIVPMPDSAHKYYVFSLTEYGMTNGALFYSIVNMNLNGGMGDVEAGWKAIYVDSNLTEQMTAVEGPDCSVWLLAVSRDDTLKAFRINYSGVHTIPVKSPVLFSRGIYEGVIGSIDVSPNKQRMALARGRASLYDFDVQAGTCSNAMYLDTGYYHYSTCFSPDNSKLYTTNESGGLYQYSVNAGNPQQILASKYLVSGLKFYAQKRAPDGKIYVVNSTQANDNLLKEIQFPNLAGAACQYANGPPLLLGLRIGLPTVVIPAMITRGDQFSITTLSGGCGAINLTLQTDTSGSNHLWNTGSTAPAIQVTSPGTYWVSYDKPCNRHVDTFKIVYDFLPTMLPQWNAKPACRNEHNGTAWIERQAGDTSTYSIMWRDAQQVLLSTTDTLLNVASGTYTLQILYGNSCDTVIEFLIPSENYDAGFTVDTLVCAGSTLSFNNTSNTHFQHFNWSFGDGSFSMTADPEHRYNQSGNYQVTLSARGAICNDTITKSITVDAEATTIGFQKDKLELCIGETLNFNPRQIDGNTWTGLHWDFGDDNEWLQESIMPLQHAYDINGVMYINMTTHFRACPDISISDSIIVYPFPLVRIGPDTSLCLGGAPIYLSNAIAGRDGDQYLWNTGDTSHSLKVVHHGTYSLRVTSENGCATTEIVDVKKDCYIDIPNAFTPNDDGYNDYFFPRQLLSGSLTRFSMKIFNRWGQLVFETTNILGRGWDGRFNDAIQPGGVYPYLIEIQVNDKYAEKYQGNVTLLR